MWFVELVAELHEAHADHWVRRAGEGLVALAHAAAQASSVSGAGHGPNDGGARWRCIGMDLSAWQRDRS